MKYFIRSVKYFFYFAILTSLIIAALVMIGAVEGDVDSIFRGGYSALWKISIFFAVVAAVYPKVGFISRDIPVDRDWNEIRDTTVSYFRDRRYDHIQVQGNRRKDIKDVRRQDHPAQDRGRL